MRIGLATTGFGTLTNDEMAQLAADAGVDCVQLFFTQTDSKYWKYNGRADVSGVAGAEAKRIANAYRSRGVEITSLGVYTSLIEPDPDELAKNIDYFADMMRIANEMDIHMLATECGAVIKPGVGKDLNESLRDEAYAVLIDSTAKLVELAAKHCIKIVFEPFFHDLLATAKATRDFIEDVNSPFVRVQLDPANLLPHNSVEEMFAALGPYIAALHAKDRKLHVTPGVPSGKGDVDYARFVSLCRQYVPHLPLIVEYVGLDTYEDALQHLRRYI